MALDGGEVREQAPGLFQPFRLIAPRSRCGSGRDLNVGGADSSSMDPIEVVVGDGYPDSGSDGVVCRNPIEPSRSPARVEIEQPARAGGG